MRTTYTDGDILCDGVKSPSQITEIETQIKENLPEEFTFVKFEYGINRLWTCIIKNEAGQESRWQVHREDGRYFASISVESLMTKEDLEILILEQKLESLKFKNRNGRMSSYCAPMESTILPKLEETKSESTAEFIKGTLAGIGVIFLVVIIIGLIADLL